MVSEGFVGHAHWSCDVAWHTINQSCVGKLFVQNPHIIWTKCKFYFIFWTTCSLRKHSLMKVFARNMFLYSNYLFFFFWNSLAQNALTDTEKQSYVGKLVETLVMWTDCWSCLTFVILQHCSFQQHQFWRVIAHSMYLHLISLSRTIPLWKSSDAIGDYHNLQSRNFFFFLKKNTRSGFPWRKRTERFDISWDKAKQARHRSFVTYFDLRFIMYQSLTPVRDVGRLLALLL